MVPETEEHSPISNCLIFFFLTVKSIKISCTSYPNGFSLVYTSTDTKLLRVSPPHEIMITFYFSVSIVGASCSGHKVSFAGYSISPQFVTCRFPIAGDILETRKTCANNLGTWSYVGFDVRKEKFITLFSVCIAQYSADTLYTYHKLNGLSILCKYHILYICWTINIT